MSSLRGPEAEVVYVWVVLVIIFVTGGGLMDGILV